PIFPQGCDHIKEEVTMKFNFRNRMVIASVSGGALVLAIIGLASSTEPNPQRNAQQQEQQGGTPQWQQEQERRQQRIQQQRLNQYSQQRRQQERPPHHRDK